MATKGTTTRAAIYTRKSSLDDRSGDNRSTTAQERECRALAERLGVSVKNVFLACHLVVQSMLGGVARVTTGLTTHTRPHEGGDEAVA